MLAITSHTTSSISRMITKETAVDMHWGVAGGGMTVTQPHAAGKRRIVCRKAAVQHYTSTNVTVKCWRWQVQNSNSALLTTTQLLQATTMT